MEPYWLAGITKPIPHSKDGLISSPHQCTITYSSEGGWTGFPRTPLCTDRNSKTGTTKSGTCKASPRYMITNHQPQDGSCQKHPLLFTHPNILHDTSVFHPSYCRFWGPSAHGWPTLRATQHWLQLSCGKDPGGFCQAAGTGNPRDKLHVEGDTNHKILLLCQRMEQ